MQSTQNVTPHAVIPTYQRYIAIDENIHQVLSLETLSLYMAFRFCAEFGQEAAMVKRTSKYMYEKAKISRRQYFKSLNELEELGLILRDPNAVIGKVAAIYIAQHLYHFKPELAPKPIPIPNSSDQCMPCTGGVHTMHTLFINSFNKDNTNSNSQPIERSNPRLAKQTKPDIIREMIDIYRETFPDNPQPHKTAIATNLEKTMRTMIRKWPEVEPNGLPLTVDGFRNYMERLKECAPKFALRTYLTAEGREKKNDLQVFCRWNTIVSFIEGKYS